MTQGPVIRTLHGLPAGDSRRHGRASRGMALIIALLIVLVLSGVSLVALQATSNRLNLVGTARIATVARSIAASGVEGTMAFAAAMPSGFTQFLVANNGEIPMNAVSAAFFDTSADGSGSFGREVVSVETAGWNSRAISAMTTHRAPGYQLGEYCFRKYVTVTNGVYANDADPAVQADLRRNIERNAQASMLSNLFVGPISCP